MLEHHTELSSNSGNFVKQMTCDENNKSCIFRRCDDCRYNLEAFKPAPGDQETLEEYQQWQSQDKGAEKVTITASLNDIFEDLREKLNNFLIHRYTKRKQQAHFFKLIDECDSSSIFRKCDNYTSR